MPNRIPQSGKEYADKEVLIRMYKDLWGFTDTEAQSEAENIFARGPSSDVYKNRMEMAWNHLQRTDPNNKLFETASAPFPESAMADPRLADPKAYAAQEQLNQRRAALSKLPPTAKVGFEPMYQFYRNGLGLSEEEAINQASAQYLKGSTITSTPQPEPAPISPGPLKPAAPTPHHLEDANLSSWQSLAQMLGYGPPRK
jgi:hypothetical protein